MDRCEEVEHLYRTRYQGFTARHFHEHLVRDHQFAWTAAGTEDSPDLVFLDNTDWSVVQPKSNAFA